MGEGGLGGIMGGEGGDSVSAPSSAYSSANASIHNNDFIVTRKPKQNPWLIIGSLVAGATLIIVARRLF